MAETMGSMSLSAVEYIVQMVDFNNCIGEYPQVFRIFFHNLQSTPPTRCVSDGDKLKTLLGAKSFQGVTLAHYRLLARHKDHPHRNRSYLAHCLTNYWPSIWKWIEYLYAVDPRVFSSLNIPIDTAGLRTMIIRLIGDITLGGPTTFGGTIKATPGVLPVLTDIWAKVSKKGVLEGRDVVEFSITTMIIYNLIEFDPSRVQTFVDTLGGEISRVATLMLNHTQRALNNAFEPGALHEGQTGLVLVSLLIGLLPGLHHALLSQNSMVLITRAFGKISTTHHGPLEPTTEGISRLRLTPFPAGDVARQSEDFSLSTLACLSFFTQASIASGGFTWIIQAIRSGFIPAMIRSASTGDSEIDDMLELTMGVLQQYLVYRSVLRALSKALQDPIISALESNLSQDTKVWRAWVKFRQAFGEFLVMKESFDIGGEHVQRCSSARCSKIEDDASFKLCSNCQEACYCSPSCQRYDWKYEGHREACASLAKDRADGISPPISPRDLAFFHFVAINGITSYRGAIFQLRDEYFASLHYPTAGRSFIILIDYSNGPLQLSVSTQNEPPKYSQYKATRHYSHLFSTVVARPLSYSAVVDVHIVVPYGSEPVYISYPSDMANALYGQMERQTQGIGPTTMHPQSNQDSAQNGKVG
ncbi:hypothetical protein BDZ94DRAFT_62221 [Collybia nuda]|uniref:MYND-type domain-containing protein n=1 Tax=Collybia nuda TaxID=64659 RepID=A0A9P5YE73_9AGAR|nr:hypothetical protein BDZ94DRAFT_62221 [Collybia nuda]